MLNFGGLRDVSYLMGHEVTGALGDAVIAPVEIDWKSESDQK